MRTIQIVVNESRRGEEIEGIVSYIEISEGDARALARRIIARWRDRLPQMTLLLHRAAEHLSRQFSEDLPLTRRLPDPRYNDIDCGVGVHRIPDTNGY